MRIRAFRRVDVCSRASAYRHPGTAEHDPCMDDNGDPQDGGRPFELWDEDRLSLEIGVPVATLRSWRSRGGGPPFLKIGRRVRYRNTTVWKWLGDQERTVDDDG